MLPFPDLFFCFSTLRLNINPRYRQAHTQSPHTKPTHKAHTAAITVALTPVGASLASAYVIRWCSVKYHRGGGHNTGQWSAPHQQSPSPLYLLCGHEETLLVTIADFVGVLRGRQLRNAREAHAILNRLAPA